MGSSDDEKIPAGSFLLEVVVMMVVSSCMVPAATDGKCGDTGLWGT